MKKTRMFVGAVACILCSAAWASGSTRVEAKGDHYRVVLETPRKIFSRGKGEARYHQRARKRLTREMSVLHPIVEKAFAKLREEEPGRWKFRAYEPEMDRCGDAVDEVEPAKKASPCQLTIRLPDDAPVSGFGSVQVAFESVPGEKDRTALEARVQKAIQAGYRVSADAGPPN